MSDKPSYLTLLNAVSQAESRAHTYLTVWADITPSADVRCVLLTVAAREGEHGLSFAKRINELGYELKVKDDPNFEKTCAIASSTTLTDLEKMEKLGLGKLDTGDKPDVFDNFFNDHTIDIQTGALLGRYIAEERDSGRLLRSCYEQLKAGAAGGGASDDRVLELEGKVDQLCETVEQLCALVEATTPAAARTSTTNGRKKRVPASR